MNDMKIFENSEFGAVRVVDVNGEPWFVARDVASALGYVDTTQAIRMHCEKAKDFRGVEMTATATPMKIIPEEDVYALIFGSHLESAKSFVAGSAMKFFRPFAGRASTAATPCRVCRSPSQTPCA